MFTIIFLAVTAFVCLILAGVTSSDRDYKNSLMCVGIAFLSVIAIADIFVLVNETRDTLRTQAIDYGYAKYEVDSKGKTTFAWILPTPPKVEPVKHAPAVVEKEKN